MCMYRWERHCKLTLSLTAPHCCWLMLLLCLNSCVSILSCVHMKVMELCSGGELFDQIVARGHFSEQDAVGIMRALLDFVAYAHSKHIVHR